MGGREEEVPAAQNGRGTHVDESHAARQPPPPPEPGELCILREQTTGLTSLRPPQTRGLVPSPVAALWVWDPNSSELSEIGCGSEAQTRAEQLGGSDQG